MDGSLLQDLAPPRIVQGRALLLAGLSAHYSHEGSAGIPAQWQRFAPWIGHIPGETGPPVSYGVVCNADDQGDFEPDPPWDPPWAAAIYRVMYGALAVIFLGGAAVAIRAKPRPDR